MEGVTAAAGGATGASAADGDKSRSRHSRTFWIMTQAFEMDMRRRERTEFLNFCDVLIKLEAAAADQDQFQGYVSTSL